MAKQENVAVNKFVDGHVKLPSEIIDALTLASPIEFDKELKEAEAAHIEGIEDKANYEIVKSNHTRLKKVLADFRKDKKTVKDTVSGWASESKSRNEAVEAQIIQVIEILGGKRQKIDDAIQAEKDRQIREERERIQNRKNRLYAAGFAFTGSIFEAGEFGIEEMDVSEMSDEEFDLAVKQGAQIISDIKKKEEEERQKLKKLQEEQDAKDKELEELRVFKAKQEEKEKEAGEPVVNEKSAEEEPEPVTMSGEFLQIAEAAYEAKIAVLNYSLDDPQPSWKEVDQVRHHNLVADIMNGSMFKSPESKAEAAYQAVIKTFAKNR